MLSMKSAAINGQKFGRLYVTDVRHKGQGGGWECRCDCGNVVNVETYRLTSGRVKSCGCLLSEWRVTHGMSKTSTYGIWRGLITRCTDSNSKHYRHYGARGIEVCQRWRDSFSNFLADMGVRPEGMSIDRIDNDGHYEPDNCRWATKSEQVRNTRANQYLEHEGLRLTISEWAVRIGVTRATLHSRLRLGWSIDRALTAPVKRTPRWHA